MEESWREKLCQDEKVTAMEGPGASRRQTKPPLSKPPLFSQPQLVLLPSQPLGPSGRTWLGPASLLYLRGLPRLSLLSPVPSSPSPT